MTRAWLVVLIGTLTFAIAQAGRAADTLPAQLTDDAFWKMIADFSEPDGTFGMDIITSNEVSYQDVIPNLRKAVKPGAVYMGVGPEQNFTYMTAIRSRMGFVIDIRRDNMLELLMYKALFELAKDRADFISLLFSRPRPAGLTVMSPAPAVFRAFAAARADTQYHWQNLQRIGDQLLKTHKFPLRNSDVARIRYIYNVFLTQ